MRDLLYRIFLIIEFALVPLVFCVLLRVTAPYGRHHRFGWGVTIGSRLAWFVMELPAVFMIPVIFWLTSSRFNPASWIYAGIWEVHYLHRTFIFPFRIRGSKKDFPLLLAVMAFGFNLLNGYVNGYFLANKMTYTGAGSFLSSHFIVGCSLFLSGLCLNIFSDNSIRSLRSVDSQTGYRIPQKGGFKWITNPNYLGEIVEWSGWAVLTWSLPGLAFALFTAANLVPRGISNHHWYKNAFSDYPEKRKILIPYLFSVMFIFL